MKNNFFHENAIDLSKDPNYSEYLKQFSDFGATFLTLDEANKIFFNKMIDSLRSCDGEYDSYEALPKRNFINLAIPYETSEHDEIKIDNVLISTLIEDYVNLNFDKTKFIFSADPTYLFAIKFEIYSYELLSAVFSEHLSEPFVLFDSSIKRAIIFHFDLRITIFSRHLSFVNEFIHDKKDQYWINFFNENFVNAITPGNQYHLDLINVNYVPRLKDVSPFSFK